MSEPIQNPRWTLFRAVSEVSFGPAFTVYVLMIEPSTPMPRTSSGKITPLCPKLAKPRIMAATIVTL